MAEPFTIKRNDTSPVYQATLKDGDGDAVSLSGATVRFHMNAKDGSSKVDAAATVVNASGGIVKYTWQAGDTDTAGRYRVEWEVTFSDSSVETFPNGTFDEVIIPADLA